MPGGRRHPGLAVPRRKRRLRSGVAPPDARQPVPGHHGPRLLSHLRDACATAPRSTTPVGINSVERFLGDEALKRGWRFEPPAERIRQARAGGRRRAVGHVGGLSPAPPRPPRDGQGSRAAAGRDDALRHPASTACRATCSTPRCSASWTWASTSNSAPRSSDIAPRCSEGGFDAAFLAVGAHIAKRAFIPAKDSPQILDAVARAALDGRRGAADARPPRRRLRRRQHRASTSRAPPSASAPPRPSSSTAARARGCRRTTSRSRRRSRKA